MGATYPMPELTAIGGRLWRKSQQPPQLPDLQQLQARAQRLFPDNDLMPDNSRNRAEWIRAVGVVRSTQNGWHLDKTVQRRR